MINIIIVIIIIIKIIIIIIFLLWIQLGMLFLLKVMSFCTLGLVHELAFACTEKVPGNIGFDTF